MRGRLRRNPHQTSIGRSWHRACAPPAHAPPGHRQQHSRLARKTRDICPEPASSTYKSGSDATPWRRIDELHLRLPFYGQIPALGTLLYALGALVGAVFGTGCRRKAQGTFSPPFSPGRISSPLSVIAPRSALRKNWSENRRSVDGARTPCRFKDRIRKAHFVRAYGSGLLSWKPRMHP
jgi:hypothetical protein